MAEKGRKPAGLIMKTLDRCRSARRSKPAPAPEGCFTVCVGAGRQRFVVRTECVNHPLFRALLEEAEEAFGYAAAGPLALPCDADAFVRVLEQIEERRRRTLLARRPPWRGAALSGATPRTACSSPQHGRSSSAGHSSLLGGQVTTVLDLSRRSALEMSSRVY